MAQRLVNVVKAFSLNINRTGKPETLDFAPGVQRVDEDIAVHWYAKAHFGDMPSEDAKASENAAALTELKMREDAVAARERELLEREELVATVVKDLKARAESLDDREGGLDKRETSLREREDKLAAAEQSASTGRKAGAK